MVKLINEINADFAGFYRSEAAGGHPERVEIKVADGMVELVFTVPSTDTLS